VAIGSFNSSQLAYLRKPIEFHDKGGKPVYVYVKSIEQPSTGTTDYLRFSFVVRRQPAKNYSGPRESEKGRRKAQKGRLYQYVFSKENSLAQNQENLKDFVFRQVGRTGANSKSV
jgi:hypothetical protein